MAVDDPTGPGNKFGPSSKQGVLVGYFINPGGAWGKDFLVFELEAVHDCKDCMCTLTWRCGEAFQKRGLPSFPMVNVGAQGDLAPVKPAAPIRG